MKTESYFPAIIALMLALAASAPAQDAKPAPAPDIKQAALETLRDAEILKLFSALPVQAGGRVKPLDTVARFTLLRMHGKQSLLATTLNDATGEKVPVTDPVTGKPLTGEKGKAVKLSAVEWLLTTWFRPDTAKALPVFIVDNSDVIVLLGLHGKSKRDRYSYNDLVSARETLMQKLEVIRDMKEDERSIEDRALGKLAVDFLDYEMMLGHFNFARTPFGQDIKSLPPELTAHVKDGKVDWAAMLPAMNAYFKAHPEVAAPMANPWFGSFYTAVLGARLSGAPDSVLRIFPPAEKSTEVWHGPGTLLEDAMSGTKSKAEDYAHLSNYGELAAASLDGAQFKTKVKSFVESLMQAASARGEVGHIGLELHYHRADYFINALVFFILASLTVALSWVKPGSGWARWCIRLSWLTALLGMVLGVTGIVIRCLIMERPPITTLYETIIFIATSCVIFGLITEAMTRKTFALVVANIAGMLGMFLSIRFLDMEAKDTMQQLQAVHITNFWLATHVPCINLGYAAGMVACLFSMVYLGMRLFGVVKAGDASARDLGRMAYGFILAGLFLSLVGTVLGGIWANYSWGRFWGWDPKENGALMIVLMNLVILHARLGNFIRETGFHACSIILGMITLFSWFATNQLGIGLHAYGELSGAWKWLYIIWTTMAIFVAYAMVLSRSDRKSRSAKAAPGLGPQVSKA